MATVVQILSAMESVKFYAHFAEALDKWRGYGGCIFFNHHEVNPWGVVDSSIYHRKCTPVVLRRLAILSLEKGGMDKEQITSEMKDWVN